MKKHLPLVFLLLSLLAVVGGTVRVIMTYPNRKAPDVRNYNLSQSRVQALKNQVVLFVKKRNTAKLRTFFGGSLRLSPAITGQF